MKRLIPKLVTGMEIYHRGYPFRLMYLTDTTNEGEVWVVLPLWTGNGTKERFFAKGSKIKMVMPEMVMQACA